MFILIFIGSGSWRRGLYIGWSTTCSKGAGRRTGYHYREDFDPHEDTFPQEAQEAIYADQFLSIAEHNAYDQFD